VGGQKPGFCDGVRVARNLGFWEILCYRRRDGKKPGFFDFLPLMSADVRAMNADEFGFFYR